MWGGGLKNRHQLLWVWMVLSSLRGLWWRRMVLHFGDFLLESKVFAVCLTCLTNKWTYQRETHKQICYSINTCNGNCERIVILQIRQGLPNQCVCGTTDFCSTMSVEFPHNLDTIRPQLLWQMPPTVSIQCHNTVGKKTILWATHVSFGPKWHDISSLNTPAPVMEHLVKFP